MSIASITDPRPVTAIQASLERHPAWEYICTLRQDILHDYSLFVYGGMPRNALLQHFYGLQTRTTDIDVLIDDTDGKPPLERIFGLGGKCKYTPYGSLVWKPQRTIKIDLIPFSTTYPEKVQSGLPPSLERLLLTTDYDVNSLALGLNDNILHDYLALDAIQSKKINLNCPPSEPPFQTLSRLVLCALKLNLSIGERGMHFIRENYRPTMEGEIKEYFRWRAFPRIEEVLAWLHDVKPFSLPQKL